MLGVDIWGTAFLCEGTLVCTSSIDASWDPEKAARVVVYGTWGGLAAASSAVLLLYNAFPRHRNLETWIRRVMCCMRLSCSLNKHTQAIRSSTLMAKGNTLSPVHQLACTLHGHFGQEDLTWSDYMLGAILTGIRQRMDHQEQGADAGAAMQQADATVTQEGGQPADHALFQGSSNSPGAQLALIQVRLCLDRWRV